MNQTPGQPGHEQPDPAISFPEVARTAIFHQNVAQSSYLFASRMIASGTEYEVVDRVTAPVQSGATELALALPSRILCRD